MTRPTIEREDIPFHDQFVRLMMEFMEETFYQEYQKEWVVIDGLKQHCMGYTFKDWMEKRKPKYYPILLAYTDYMADMYDGPGY